jgi:enoyl-CoA hydratase/carnithine racemase
MFNNFAEAIMALVEFSIDETVAVVSMNSGENRLNPPFIKKYLEVLDQIERETAVNALIVHSSHAKIFSNGLDLEWLGPAFLNRDSGVLSDFFCLMNRLFKRILLYPMITVAAISGHAFAAGAILTCAFDFRFMRLDRGYFCLPEVDLGMPFLPGMLALLKKAIPLHSLEELQYTGRRLTAVECETHHIVTKACPIDTLMEETLAFAKGLTKKRGIIGEMKRRMYRDIVQVMDAQDAPIIESAKFMY